MKESSKGGRHTSLTPCTHCVMVRFDDLEWDKLLGMMDTADEKIKATFIKQIIENSIAISKILTTFAAIDSATLRLCMRTKAELLFYTLWTIQRTPLAMMLRLIY